MGPSITYSNVAFIQPYLSKRRVMLVLREFFFCQLCRESEKKMLVQLLLFILTEFYKNF